ncbi:hypothetical protein [Nonomuraea rhizosphaerae]|uniref:hypothetical protein n=1 Tax=Nonomuraea rhizosphaerae TaxID=2665663 RepID=UPI001C605264|nr:hypothetical protein [Nonomuraea rhizosphaerae]
MRPWDAFAAAEAEVRAMVANPRWQGLPVPARAQFVAARVLVTPDGDRWLFGAHARWHLHDPADGRWHLAPPPRGTPARRTGHPAAVLPARVIPRGPDFAEEPGSTQAFVGPDVPGKLTEGIRGLLRAEERRSERDYPLSAFYDIFARDVPSTIAVIWGTIIWCSYAPAFDGNERLITAFGEYLRRPLPGDEWVRWLPAPPLLDLVTLVAERLRAGESRAALRLAALIADTAQILLSDPRFRPRALALLTMVEPTLRQPHLDDAAALRDDHAVRQAWLDRLPERLSRAVLVETDPATHFRHTVYDLVEALSFTTEPARAAAAFLADLSDSRALLPGHLDHRLRRAYEELAKAGLTGTSAAETTQPEGMAVRTPPPYPWRAEPPGTGAYAVPASRTGAMNAAGAIETGAHLLPQTGAHAVPQTGAHAMPQTGAHAVPRTGSHAVPEPRVYEGRQPAGEGGVETSGSSDAASGSGVEPPDRSTAAAVLGAAYAVGLAWGRVTGARVPERGFAGSAALVHRLIPERDDMHS